MVVGTPQYMSPEQMTAAKLDARSDLFSLGSIAFEAFTGRRAFPGNSLREVADAVHKRALPLPTHVNPALPRSLNGWFSKACARDRDDRFKSASEMVAALERAFEQADSVREEKAPDAVRTPRSFGAVWMLVFLAAAALAFFLARGR